MTLDELRQITDGMAPDYQHINKVLVELKKCPRCGDFLSYRSFSNATVYKCFGVCEPCDYAQLCWTERVELAVAKRRMTNLFHRRRRSQKA